MLSKRVKFGKVSPVRVVFLAAVTFVCRAAAIDDQQFNGRWDISVNAQTSPRAWWLEVSGAGTNTLKGKFLGSPFPQPEEIPKLSISEGELRFALEGRFRRSPEKALYWARLEDGKLKGTFEIEGDPSSYLEWTGTRAPALPDKDDSSWKRSDPVVLFDGHDLGGWQPALPGKPPGWTVREGILENTTNAVNLVSEKKFWNFSLEAEFRILPRGNSGIALRGRYEVQLADDFDKPPSNRGSGAILGRIAPSINAIAPPGEWQTLAVRLIGRQVTVILNGIRVVDKQTIEGPTAIATDANESDPGPVLLQGDRGLVQFRKLVVYPLAKQH